MSEAVDPAFVPKETTDKVLRKLQQLLWLDEDSEGQEFWNPSKELGHEAVDAAAAILRDAGLSPSNVRLGDP